jgi:heme-degrading monooxygenase HmoA
MRSLASRLPSLRSLFALPWLLVLGSCTVATPFRGPGYDRRAGVTVATEDGQVLVALTRARLDRATRAPFDRSIGRVAGGMDQFDGLVGFSFRKELFGPEVWTMSVWTDQQALDRFLESALHDEAMAAGGPATQAFEFHAERLPAQEIPIPWSRALSLLDAAGGE